MQIFSQKQHPSRQILLTTVYDHRNSRASSAETPQFSFLIQTLPSKPDEEEDINQHIFRLQRLNETILENMQQVDAKLKEELAKRGRLEFLKLNDRPFPFINDSVHYKGHPTQFSQVQKQASVFEIDENNNYFKYHQKSIVRHNTPIFSTLTVKQTKSKQKITKTNKHIQSQSVTHQMPTRVSHHRKRIYESVLSKFSTATLLKMNSEQI